MTECFPSDILAEWSKALCSGRSLNWRRFKSCRCQYFLPTKFEPRQGTSQHQADEGAQHFVHIILLLMACQTRWTARNAGGPPRRRPVPRLALSGLLLIKQPHQRKKHSTKLLLFCERPSQKHRKSQQSVLCRSIELKQIVNALLHSPLPLPVELHAATTLFCLKNTHNNSAAAPHARQQWMLLPPTMSLMTSIM